MSLDDPDPPTNNVEDTMDKAVIEHMIFFLVGQTRLGESGLQNCFLPVRQEKTKGELVPLIWEFSKVASLRIRKTW